MRVKMFSAAMVLIMASALRAETNLNKLLDAELSRFPAKAGVYVKHLGTGETAVVLGDDHFNSASVIKIPVMILAFRLVEQGKLNLSDRVEIKRSDLRGGS